MRGNDVLILAEQICEYDSAYSSILSPRPRKGADLSPQGNVPYAKELARRFGNKGIVCISLHPGQLKTELMRETSAFMQATRVSREILFLFSSFPIPW